MKKLLVTLLCIVSLVIMTACGGSPVDKALAKVDASIERLEKAQKKGDKLSKEELDAMGKELEEPVEILTEAVKNDEVSGITKIKIVAKLSNWAILAAGAGINSTNLDDIMKDAKK